VWVRIRGLPVAVVAFLSPVGRIRALRCSALLLMVPGCGARRVSKQWFAGRAGPGLAAVARNSRRAARRARSSSSRSGRPSVRVASISGRPISPPSRAAQVMRDNYARLFEPPFLHAGVPNPRHLSTPAYLALARAAAHRGAAATEPSPPGSMSPSRTPASLPPGSPFPVAVPRTFASPPGVGPIASRSMPVPPRSSSRTATSASPASPTAAATTAPTRGPEAPAGRGGRPLAGREGGRDHERGDEFHPVQRQDRPEPARPGRSDERGAREVARGRAPGDLSDSGSGSSRIGQIPAKRAVP
jgi:hypothetical protein